MGGVMPRPRVLRQPRFTALYLTHDIYEKLREIAYLQRKSVSQLIREIVERYLREQGREA
jgi:predicted DNA-binding protein